MKKTALLLSLLFAGLISFGQQVKFGFTTSPTLGFNNIEQNTAISDGTILDTDSESTFGFQYGVMADFDINDEERYFFSSGIVLHHTGYNFNQTSDFPQSSMVQNRQANVQYLEIPTSLKLKTNEIGFLKYYGLFGLNHGIRVGSKFPNDYEPEGSAEVDDFSAYNAALNVGGGIEYNLSGDTSLTGGIFYNNGFSKALDDTRGNLKQNQLGLRLGVFF